MKISPTIVIDTREQKPLRFDNMPAERGTLATGDYSVKGLEHLIAVERKSLDDLLRCVGRNRDRFKAELQRLRAFRFRVLVVECSAADIERGGTDADVPRGGWRSRLQLAHVMGSLAAWTAQYGLPVWMAGDHDAAARFVERFLYQAARCVLTDYEAAAEMLATAPTAA